MNYQSPNVEESRTSRKKKSGKRAADETFANLDCAGAARTRLIAEELIEQLTRTQTGDLADQGSFDRLDHLNISLQLLAPAPTAQANLSTITATSKEAHKLVRDLEESVNGRRGQRAQRRAESSLRLKAITQHDAQRLLRDESPDAAPEPTLAAPAEVALAVAVENSLPIAPVDPTAPEQPEQIQAQESQVEHTQIATSGLLDSLVRKTEKKPEMKSLGSLLKRPAQKAVAEIAQPSPPKEKKEVAAPETTAVAVEPPKPIEVGQVEQAQIESQLIEEHSLEEEGEEQIGLNSLMPAPIEVRNVEAQKISKANWQAAKEIAGGKESGALLLNIISEPERKVTDMLRQAKWTIKKWTE
jgi:hypothetical protein